MEKHKKYLRKLRKMRHLSFFAFSLIELLVSLIIISLLIGAFAPVITKKLKASDVTVGSFSNNDKTNTKPILKMPESQQDCDKFNALFISKEMNDGAKNICVTRWNIGDNIENGGVPIANNVEKHKVAEKCIDFGNCCWQGSTSATCTSSGNGSTYSGCTRTVCQWRAASESCSAYSPDGTAAGFWRLPTYEEATGWKNNLNYLDIEKKDKGLQLCGSGASLSCNFGAEGSCPPGPVDANGNKVNGATLCYPNYLITNTITNTTNYTVRYAWNISGASIVPQWEIWPFSARCVLDYIIDTKEEAKDPEPAEPNNEIRWREPRSYRDCAPFNAMFVPKEYNGVGGKNLCVTKYNAFDTNGPYVSEAKVFLNGLADVGTSCSGNYCCWKGTTSISTILNNNTNDKYGASTYHVRYRPVCTFKAAENICNFWAPFGTKPGSWRLPTLAELNGWKDIINLETKENPKLNRWMGAGGLQLCERHTNTKGSDQCYPADGKCLGAYGDGCAPDHIWGKNGAVGYLAEQNGGVFGTYVYSDDMLNYAFSVRCVTDEVMDFD